MNIPNEIWAKLLTLMEKELAPTTIDTWFGDATPVRMEGDTFVLCSPSEFKRTMLRSRYHLNLENALREIFSSDFTVVVVDEEMARLDLPVGLDGFLPGSEEYTFDRFVVGSSNKFAHAASRAVADAPGSGYNPLFIWGESGLGKTHLLYAIAHEVHRRHPDYRIVYVKGDAFTNDLVQAIRSNTQPEFRDKYRNADLFLMDDVQFIARSEFSQEEMFHTFNTLRDSKKQIVFTADRPPKDMYKLEDRLVTRFGWGLLANIDPPDYETRMAILKSKAAGMGLNIPDPVLHYVADNITANVRQLEGTINKILAFQSLMGDNVDVDTVIRAVKDMLQDKSDILPSTDVIMEEVCKFFSVDKDMLRGKARSGNILQARQVAMYLTRQLTQRPLKNIGQDFGNRDHATVLNSIQKIEKALETDPNMREILKDIKGSIHGRYER